MHHCTFQVEKNSSLMTHIVRTYTGEKYTLFFSIRSPFSNFYPCQFRIVDENVGGYKEAKTFSCTEQYYMYHKALSCGDYETAAAIMLESEAKAIKKLGRYVRNFDPARWEKMCMTVMRRGNMEKYIQNSDLRQKLFMTLGTQMVECSPTDTVWGIGLDITDPNATNRITWRGENRLGQILTEIRDELSKRNEYAEEVKGAQEDMRRFDAFTDNFFNKEACEPVSNIPCSATFIPPFTPEDMSFDSQNLNGSLPLLSSTLNDTISADSTDSPIISRQRRKRKSEDGIRNCLQRLNSSSFEEYEKISNGVKHMKYEDDEEDDGASKHKERSTSSGSEGAKESDTKKKKSSQRKKKDKKDKKHSHKAHKHHHKHRKQSTEKKAEKTKKSSRSRHSSRKSSAISTASDSPEKHGSKTIVDDSDISITIFENSNPKGVASDVDMNASVSNVLEDGSFFIYGPGHENYCNFLARLRSKPSEMWKTASEGVLPFN